MAGMNPKIFTAAEANRMLPLVGVVARDAMETWKKLETAKRELRKASARRPKVDADGVAARKGSGPEQKIENDIKSLERELEDRRAELEELGCYLRDPERGLVDFPSFVGSELVYLCWVPGETSVTHYHGMREGFVGRKPLPAPAPQEKA